VEIICGLEEAEYHLLKTKCILRDNGTEDVNLFCDLAAAQSLLEFCVAQMPQVVSRNRAKGQSRRIINSLFVFVGQGCGY
jgi:hypothetical protein